MSTVEASKIKDNLIQIISSSEKIFDFTQEANAGLCLIPEKNPSAFWINIVLQENLNLSDSSKNPFETLIDPEDFQIENIATYAEHFASWDKKLDFLLADCDPVFFCINIKKVFNPTNKENFYLIGFKNDSNKNQTLANRKKEYQIRELKSSERRFKSLVKHASDAILIVNAKGKPIFVSHALENILGYTSKEAKDIYILDVCHPDFVEEIKQCFKDCLNNPGKPIIKHASKWKHKNGSWRWLEGIFTNMLHDPAINGIVDNFRDITKLMNARNVLVMKSKLQRLLMNISTRYINIPLEKVEETINESLMDLGRFVEADRAYIFDYDFNNNTCTNTFEWCEENISPEIHRNHKLPIEIFDSIWLKNHKSGLPNIVPKVEELDNEEFRTLLLKQDIKSLITLPLMKNGECIGFVGFDSVKRVHFYNSTEITFLNVFAEMLVNFRMRMDNTQRLQELVIKVEEQNKRLMDFSFITSHNIRSSVSNLIGLTDLIEIEGKNSEYTDMLRSSAHKLDSTIKNISQLLNFESALVQNKIEDCKLIKLTERVLDKKSELINNKNAEIQVKIPKDYKIKIASEYLENILLNLLDNALKYGVDENNKCIKIEAKPTSTHFEIKIIDFGNGINLKQHGKKLFKLGTRLSNNSDGQGIGLFMCKTQVRALKGEIAVKSKIGEGTTFIIKLNNYR
tara:strand:+ start:4306 stop:6354 length:2049 start_codon:yes stop_codon:yes gene_type:complete